MGGERGRCATTWTDAGEVGEGNGWARCATKWSDFKKKKIDLHHLLQTLAVAAAVPAARRTPPGAP